MHSAGIEAFRLMFNILALSHLALSVAFLHPSNQKIMGSNPGIVLNFIDATVSHVVMETW